MQVIAAPHPLRSDITPLCVQDGLTLAEILEQAQPDPILRAHAHIFVGDVRVPRERWARIRPKASSVVTIRVVAQGGGGGSKNPLRTIMTIAVMAFAPQVGALAFGSGLAATALTAGVAAVGMLAVNAIAPVRPASMDTRSGTTKRDSPTLTIEGARNNARPFGVVPVVLGKHRHVPPLAAQSYTEIVGDDQYLRMIVVWGYGPLKIENLRIGDTPLGMFDNVSVQNREGRAGEPPITIFPSQVQQEPLGITLKQADGWQVRRSSTDADELSIDIVFPQGLVRFDDRGNKQSRTVAVQVQFRKVGASEWEGAPFTEDIQHYTERKEIVGYREVPYYNNYRQVAVYSTVREPSWLELDTVRFTQKRTSAVRHGFRWPVPRGQYEIRVRRTTSDTTDSQIMDTVQWTAVRTYSNGNPIQFDQPVAVTALSIKATDQLNGTVDQLTADVSSYVTNWNGAEVISSNPALLYRHVLQGPANARRLSNDRVDLAALQAWGDHCAAEGFEFNMVRDFQSSVWDTLADIAAAGRASPSQRDGKWSVVVDKPQSYPVQHFTPRNSWGFEAEKTFPDPPHAFRIRFASRLSNYEQDERIVYADGYHAGNAEVFETLDAPGVVDPGHIWKFGRFQLAQAILRPERWTLNLDFEHLVARRGSWVKVTHDVLLVGLGSGRIKEVLTDADGNATGFISDEVLHMEAGTTYGVSIRTVGDAALSRELVTVAGDNHVVDFASSIPAAAAPMVGDLFGFGESGKETVDALVLSVEPQSDLVARLVLIPYSPAVYDSDKGAIPAFDTGITPLPAISDAMVAGVRTGETVLTLGVGDTLTPHAAIALENPQYPGLVADAQVRVSGTGEPYVEATIARRNGTEIWIGEVDEGETYDIRVRWLDPSRLVPGRWSYVNAQIISGQLNPPQGLRGLTISAFGGSALLRWDQPPDIDVRIGGEIRFRHSQAENASLAQWNTSTSIGEAANGNSTTAVLPLKRGTYLARVYDKGGRPSAEVAAISTKQASVLAFANVGSIAESPIFAGEVDAGAVVIDDLLQLTAVGQFDAIEDFDSLSALDSFGGIASEGYYTFAAGFDFEAIKRVRLTSVIEATAINVLDRLDERDEPIDSWEDFDGTLQAQSDARVQVRHTDDDPDTSPEWSVWNNLDSAEFEARGFQFRVHLTSRDTAYNIRIEELGVIAEEVI